MRLEHADYIRLVGEAYISMRANKTLSPLLAQSTPANIRRECLNVYRERYDRKDEQVLRAFFGPADTGRQFLEAIQGFATDKFKPLDNYLKGDTEKTDDRNLDLLAWLLDFPHRPYVYGMEVILNEEELSIIGRSKKENKPGTKQEKGSSNGEDKRARKWSNKLKRIFAIFLIVVVCLSGGYFIWQQKRNKQLALGNANTGCMYWAGDHYEKMHCNEERRDRLKLSLDPEKMKSFKRIMQEDTITEKSIGKVYYIKISGRIEYYTAGGSHPVDVTRTLKPLSPYMFEKYLSKQGSDNSGSVAERNVKPTSNP